MNTTTGFGRRDDPFTGSDVSPGWAGFDGDNVIRLEGASEYPNWRFVHGPGLDDPLVGLRNQNGTYTKYYYLTDGRGRQLAFTDSVGNDEQAELVYTQNGGNQAGGITDSHGFENSRGESVGAPALSFYRNRYYDQQTGRFTQEDPIGIAGGVNLYQYAGNNPAAYTDPFGLCVPPLTPIGLVAYGIGIGAAVFSGTRVAHNASTGQPLDQNLQSDVARGGLIGGGAGMVVGAAGITPGTAQIGTATAGALGSRADAIAKLKELGPEAVQGLRDFFKSGKLPEGLSPEALQRYPHRSRECRTCGARQVW